jgi:diguanylate cyclase (GGDEF)-like protein/PAS domain S-box-containing protein
MVQTVQLEHETRRGNEQFLAREKNVLEMIAMGRPLLEVLDALARSIEELAEGRICSVLLVDRDGKHLRYGAAPSLPAQWRRLADGFEIGPRASSCGAAAFGGKPVIVSDIATDPVWADASADFRDQVLKLGLRACWSFPIKSREEKVLGTLAMFHREPRSPSAADLILLERAAHLAGIALERQRAEEVLRQSEERFRRLTEMSADWYWEQDEHFRFTMVSENLNRAMKRSPEAVLGKTRWEVPATNMTEADWAAHRATLEAHQPFRNLVLQRIDAGGEVHFAKISGEPIVDADGRFRGYRGIGHEFTEHRHDEEELRRFRASMDMSGDMIFLSDRAAMRFIDVNETACRLLGYSREEMLGMGPQDILPVTREQLEDAYDAMDTTGSTDSGMTSHYRCKDGSMLPFESTRRMLQSGDQRILVVISRDTRERIAAEDALRKSNERFEIVARATNDVIRDWDLLTDEHFWNQNLASVFGYRREDIDQTAEFWYEGIHVEDRVRVVSSLHELIDSREKNWSVEYRFRRQDGSYAQVLDRGQVIRDDSGKAVRMIGAMADISSRKQAEETVRTQALQQRLIAEFGQAALANTDFGDLLNRAVELTAATLLVDFCHVLELNPDGRQLTYRAAVGWPHEWSGRYVITLAPGGRMEHILSRREPLIVEDYSAPDFTPSRLVKYGIRSGMAVHIPGGSGPNKSYGILGVHTLQSRRFTEDDISFLRSVANILAVAIERKGSEDRLSYLAQFDALTALPNRNLFQDRLTQSIARSKRGSRPMAVLFIDLDRFKTVNDTLGHGAGDNLLKEAAARLSQCVRGGDTAGRFSGDEFGAILSDLVKPADAGLVAQKILDILALPYHLEGQETFISASIGITLYPADGASPEALVMNADAAMYRAKEQGRNNYQYFTREMNERTLMRVQMELALRRAVERKEFLLHFQPKVELASEAICGFEALLRWQHPQKGLISPVEFIPVLEDMGLIVQVGEWVLLETCRQIKAWRGARLKVPPVAVNLSARQFQQKDLGAKVRRILRKTGIDSSLIQFEITESLLMKDPESAARTLRGLKASGIKIAVDDFGTGYSSLAYLKRFPLDALKIDRAFIREVTTNSDDATITLAIIGLAHSLKLKVIAEGVETRAQLKLLTANGCDEAQGYYFSRPTTADECARMLKKGRLDSLVQRGPARRAARS